MENYTEELKNLVERTMQKGSMDKHAAQALASLIWRIDQRIAVLEEQIVADDKPVEPKRGRGRPPKTEE